MPKQLEMYWTVNQVAERLHVTPGGVRKWLGSGKLAKTKAGANTLVSETALQAFLKRSTKAKGR
ncbi:MAG TPA: helix-turn-helix domain-containing protein [Acidobacteriaceae bacterium]|nr:helix-turn-helix domain-containing protein [Acidobacteriaceae bacterium]